MYLEIVCLKYMYEKDLALNDLQWLMSHKTKPNQTKPNQNLSYKKKKKCSISNIASNSIWNGDNKHLSDNYWRL